MIDKDDEDMWLECFSLAADLVPKNHSSRIHRIRVVADQIFDACKAKTERSVERQKKFAPVVQLKQ